MKNGFSRFGFYLDQLDELMNKAAVDKDPARWLFSNNARTTFFMLEGLSRLYSGLHDKKMFEKIRQQVKIVEDLLGCIDYNEWLKSSLSDKNIPELCVEYIKKKSSEAVSGLNVTLEKDGWINGNRTAKIRKRLKKADWKKEAKEVKAVSGYYSESIKKIDHIVIHTEYLFDNIEEDVHELRRKLRWLSIYPQAMQGMFRYSEEKDVPAHLKKYLTPEIINSPFNKLPPEGNNTCFVFVDKNHFLALSWMIAKLGSLKDEGLLINGLADALKYGAGYTDNLSLSESYSRLGQNPGRIQQILDEAEAITKTFIRERTLQHLIAPKNWKNK